MILRNTSLYKLAQYNYVNYVMQVQFLLTQQIDLGCEGKDYSKCALIKNCDQPPVMWDTLRLFTRPQ